MRRAVKLPRTAALRYAHRLPYARTRHAVREVVNHFGTFIQIYVATPPEVCQSHDRKDLYVKARKGLIPEFTGISDPYDIPERAEVRIDTCRLMPKAAAEEIFSTCSTRVLLGRLKLLKNIAEKYAN